ncbi:MAG: T9SS type A sorting domain-containing protein [Candidatus Cloacimonetes bacterium]|nr:T9SS type A sorting domain-containing protein [Candidatus Cloacimonadota bacterium]
MDEPIRQWYPLYHYIHTGQTDPRPCLVDSLGALADHVAAYILQMEEWFPEIPIGQIGLYPEVGIEQFMEWIIALEARDIFLPFLHIDVHGTRVDQYLSFGYDIDIVSDMLELKSFLEVHNVDFGIIFTDPYWSSQAWEEDIYTDSFYYERTMNWVNFVNDGNIEPDHSIFQSWIYPVYSTGYGPNEIPINLPEYDLSVYSHTRLINEATSIFVGVDPEASTDLPMNSVLHQNYPNPFNPSTTISFKISSRVLDQNLTRDYKDAKIEIYNLKGQKVKKLEIRNLKLGINEVVWNGKDDNNKSVSSGIYLYQLKAGNVFSETKKMMLLK